MPRGSISGQGRIQVSPPEGWGIAVPDSVVIIDDPESPQVPDADQARMNGNREQRSRSRGWRSRLAEIIDPD